MSESDDWPRAQVRGIIIDGDRIVLEHSLPELNGKHVLVRIRCETAPHPRPDDSELARAWDEWVTHGPHGPLDDDSDPEQP